MAEQAAIGQDVVDFAEALGLGQFALAGFDWGNRAACVASILHPYLVKGLIAIGGYSVQNTIIKEHPASAINEARRWYQWYFNTPQDRVGLEEQQEREAEKARVLELAKTNPMIKAAVSGELKYYIEPLPNYAGTGVSERFFERVRRWKLDFVQNLPRQA